VQDGIPELESFLQRAGRNPGAGKLPAACRTESRSAKASCSVQGVFPFCGGAFPSDEKEARTDAGAPVVNIGFLRASVCAGLV